jgi:hypothetical protein
MGLITFFCFITMGVVKCSIWLPWFGLGQVNCCWPSPAVSHGSGSCGTHDHVFLSHNSGCPVWFWINCCWSLPAQSFMVLGPAGLTTVFFCLITLWVILLQESCWLSKLLLALTGSQSWFWVLLGSMSIFGLSKTFMCFEMRPSLQQEGGSDYYWWPPLLGGCEQALTH